MTAGSAALAPGGEGRQVLVFRYTRLSNDPGGKRADHETQNRGLDELGPRWGLPAAVQEFSDDDRSASKLAVERPDWLALLDAIRRVDARRYQPVVVAWSQDRLSRRPDETWTVANELHAKGGRLITWKENDISVTPGSRGQLYMQGLMATTEAENISSRTLAGMETAAQAGKRHGVVAYGWRFEGHVDERTGRAVGRDVIDPRAAAIVRWAALRVIAGHSLRGIAEELNARGIPAPGAGKVTRKADPARGVTELRAASTWGPTKLRQLITRKANIGVRVHTRPSSHQAGTREYPAAWPPIMDEVTYYRVCGVLADPKRRQSTGNVAVHLLSGIATCSTCGKVVSGQKSRKRTGDVVRVYRCAKSHVIKAEARTDAVVETWVFSYLGAETVRAQFRRQDNAQDDSQAELEALREKVAQREAMWDAGDLTDEQFARMNRELQAQIKAVTDRAAASRDRAVYADLLEAKDVEAAWEAMPLPQRRTVIATLFSVVLHPATLRGRYAFDSSTIVITRKD